MKVEDSSWFITFFWIIYISGYVEISPELECSFEILPNNFIAIQIRNIITISNELFIFSHESHHPFHLSLERLLSFSACFEGFPYSVDLKHNSKNATIYCGFNMNRVCWVVQSSKLLPAWWIHSYYQWFF